MIGCWDGKEKTFEELMEEALAQIPLYSREWTNYNPSDPGITILENLTAFNLLQRSYICRVTDQVQEKLLKLVGFEAFPGRCARVLLQAEQAGKPFSLPVGQKFYVGDICYETDRQTEIDGNRMTAVYSRRGDIWTDCGSVLKRDTPLRAEIFGKKPKEGSMIFLVCEKRPAPGSELICYVKASGNTVRNKISPEQHSLFAELEWQCYTKYGFERVECRDETGSFLTDGELRFRFPETPMEVYREGPVDGFVIRGILRRSDYDLPPSVREIYGFLFEAWQRESRSVCFACPAAGKIRLYCDLLEEDYIHVYCMEADGAYRMYYPAGELETKGRYYQKRRVSFGAYEFLFREDGVWAPPCGLEDGIRIVAYGEEMMSRYELGRVEGYDDQKIKLPVECVVARDFSIIAERERNAGDFIYDFIKPGCTGKDDLCYELSEFEGSICIRDAGAFIGARIFLCGLSTTTGAGGNARAGNIFQPSGYEGDAVFSNPAPAQEGFSAEQISDVRKRFLMDLNIPRTAVSEEDYEKMVKDIPGLCIHKVKAVFSQEKNEVSIAVKPWSDEAFPRLSGIYKRLITRYMEERRLLCTTVKIVQPVYMPVDVSGTIYVKKHYEHCREKIEKELCRFLDYVNGEQRFGELLKFDRLFHMLEELECVEYVYDLSLLPRSRENSSMQGMDIKPGDHCLCCPGKFYLELNTCSRQGGMIL